MSIQTIARDLIALCKARKFAEAGEKYWADNVLTVEPRGENAEIKGKQAARAKREWWDKNHEIHAFEVEGPYINGDQFVLHFKLDMTNKPSGKRLNLDEVGLYTIRNEKITEERFFYGE